MKEIAEIKEVVLFEHVGGISESKIKLQLFLQHQNGIVCFHSILHLPYQAESSLFLCISSKLHFNSLSMNFCFVFKLKSSHLFLGLVLFSNRSSGFWMPLCWDYLVQQWRC